MFKTHMCVIKIQNNMLKIIIIKNPGYIAFVKQYKSFSLSIFLLMPKEQNIEMNGLHSCHI